LTIRLVPLLSAQRALRNRFDDFRRALDHENRTAVGIALMDFEQHLRRWTEAEEAALIPALERAHIPGRDVRRELRLQYVQTRELAHYLLQQVEEGIHSARLIGYVENLERRLRAHEKEMAEVYYPAADLTDAEWEILEKVKPDE